MEYEDIGAPQVLNALILCSYRMVVRDSSKPLRGVPLRNSVSSVLRLFYFLEAAKEPTTEDH